MRFHLSLVCLKHICACDVQYSPPGIWITGDDCFPRIRTRVFHRIAVINKRASLESRWECEWKRYTAVLWFQCAGPKSPTRSDRGQLKRYVTSITIPRIPHAHTSFARVPPHLERSVENSAILGVHRIILYVDLHILYDSVGMIFIIDLACAYVAYSANEIPLIITSSSNAVFTDREQCCKANTISGNS